MAQSQKSVSLSGLDPNQQSVVDDLNRLGLPVNRAMYLSVVNPEMDPSQMLDAEDEAELPVELQLQPPHDSSS